MRINKVYVIYIHMTYYYLKQTKCNHIVDTLEMMKFK